MQMGDDWFRMLELYGQGLNCSQMLISLGLTDMGKDNPDFVQAVAGLGGGIGFTGKTCGALTGGACLLSLYANASEESDKVTSVAMIDELVDWFETEMGQAHGGINCEDILSGPLEGSAAPPGCAQIVIDTYAKIQEILADNRSQTDD